MIVQTIVSPKDNVDNNVLMADYVAQELETEGRITPIAYSMTDPVFRAAVQGGKLKDAPDRPNLNQSFEVARVLGAEYVMVVEGVQVGNAIKTKAKIYRDRKQVWKDEQNLVVNSIGATNQDSTCKSLARTMVLRMNSGPFKGFVRRKVSVTPELSKGQEPILPVVTRPVPAQAESSAWKAEVRSLIANGKKALALAALRDAVDAAPLDVERRMELITFLMRDDPKAAGEEARRSISLVPDRSDLRALSAKAWMQAGLPEEAQKDLNEAVARDPNGQNTRLMLGELALGQLDAEKALDHLDQAIKQKDSGQARFLRGACHGLLGHKAEMLADFKQGAVLQEKPSDQEITERYNLVADIVDRLVAQDGIELRSLTQKVVVRPKDNELKQEVTSVSKRIVSRSELISVIATPVASKQINEKRLLVHNLMAQSLTDLQAFCDKGDEDSLADCRINLGEALRQLGLIKKKS